MCILDYSQVIQMNRRVQETDLCRFSQQAHGKDRANKYQLHFTGTKNGAQRG